MSPIVRAKFLTFQLKPVVNQKGMYLKGFGFPVQSKIGPLQLAIYVTLGQDKQKGYIISNGNFLKFVCLLPVRLFLSSMVVLYHMNG